MSDREKPFAAQYNEVKKRGLLQCVCRACAAKMGSLDSAQQQHLHLCMEMKGHPALAAYIEQGYEIITF